MVKIEKALVYFLINNVPNKDLIIERKIQVKFRCLCILITALICRKTITTCPTPVPNFSISDNRSTSIFKYLHEIIKK